MHSPIEHVGKIWAHVRRAPSLRATPRTRPINTRVPSNVVGLTCKSLPETRARTKAAWETLDQSVRGSSANVAIFQPPTQTRGCRLLTTTVKGLTDPHSSRLQLQHEGYESTPRQRLRSEMQCHRWTYRKCPARHWGHSPWTRIYLDSRVSICISVMSSPYRSY